MPRSLLRPTMAGLSAVGILVLGATFAALAIGGFLFGIVIALGVIAIGALIALSDSESMPREVNMPGRDELIAMAAAIGVLAVSIAVALLTEGWAWIGVPIGGGAAIYMIYAYSRPEERRAPRVIDSEIVVTPTADLRIGLVDILKTVDIFKGLPLAELRSLAGLGDVRTIPEGQMMGAEGQIGDSVYVVLDGRAHLSANSSVGRLTARIAGPGESFPLAALLSDGRLITTVKANTDMKVWQVDRSILREHFKTHCQTGAHVYEKAAEILADRYRSTIWRLTQTTADAVKGDAFWANV